MVLKRLLASAGLTIACAALVVAPLTAQSGDSLRSIAGPLGFRVRIAPGANYPVVDSVVPGGYAARAGVRPGDSLIKVIDMKGIQDSLLQLVNGSTYGTRAAFSAAPTWILVKRGAQRISMSADPQGTVTGGGGGRGMSASGSLSRWADSVRSLQSSGVGYAGLLRLRDSLNSAALTFRRADGASGRILNLRRPMDSAFVAGFGANRDLARRVDSVVAGRTAGGGGRGGGGAGRGTSGGTSANAPSTMTVGDTDVSVQGSAAISRNAETGVLTIRVGDTSITIRPSRRGGDQY